jgi:hypothetical protein
MLILCFFFSLLGVDCDVVHVYQEPTLCHLFLEYCVHHHLKGGWRVCEAKEHYHWLKQSFWRKEGCFSFIAFFDVDIIVPPSYIELSEESASAEAVNGLWN